MPDAAVPPPNALFWSRFAGAIFLAACLSAGGCLFSPHVPAGKIICSSDSECPDDAGDDAQAAIDVAAEGPADAATDRLVDAPTDGPFDSPSTSDVADGPADRGTDTVAGDPPSEDGNCQSPPQCQPPLTVVLSVGASTPIRGNTGAATTIYQDACPIGSAVIGFHVVTDATQNQGIEVVAQLQAVCGSLKVSPDRTTLQVTPGGGLFWRGTITGPVKDLLCPQNQVAIGFDGRSFQLLDQLALRCVPLTLSGTTVSMGIPTTLPPAGGAGGTAFARTDCPVGQIAGATNIGVSQQISAFGLICVTVAVR